MKIACIVIGAALAVAFPSGCTSQAAAPAETVAKSPVVAASTPPEPADVVRDALEAAGIVIDREIDAVAGVVCRGWAEDGVTGESVFVSVLSFHRTFHLSLLDSDYAVSVYTDAYCPEYSAALRRFPTPGA